MIDQSPFEVKDCNFKIKGKDKRLNGVVPVAHYDKAFKVFVTLSSKFNNQDDKRQDAR